MSRTPSFIPIFPAAGGRKGRRAAVATAPRARGSAASKRPRRSNPVRATSVSTPAGSKPSASNRISYSLSNALPESPLRVRRFGRAWTGWSAAQQRASSMNMSSAVLDELRACRISRWQPRASGLWIEPGIANTSRPCSAASRAVISDPLCSAASTTSVPTDRPLMIRLRRGKCCLAAAARRSASPTPAPRSRRRFRRSAAFSRG